MRNKCPARHKCLSLRIVYEATVTNNIDDAEKIYHGLCETSLKESWSNHISSLRHEKMEIKQNFLINLGIKEQ